jgi:hypothetical protein
MSGFLGAGDVYIDRLDTDGNPTGLRLLGNVSKFSIAEAGDIKDRVSFQKETYGASLDTVTIKKPAVIKIESDELDVRNIALALMGEDLAYSQTSGTVASGSPEDVIVHLGKVAQLAHREVSTLVLKNSAGDVTYVAGTDYVLKSANLGLVSFPVGSAITEGATIKATYSYAAITGGVKVRGGAIPQIKGRILLDGKNFADDKQVVVDCYKATIKPTGEVDFISADYAKVTLEGTLTVPEGQSEAYLITSY